MAASNTIVDGGGSSPHRSTLGSGDSWIRAEAAGVQGDGKARYADFASIWSRASDVPGWLTEAQARELWTLGGAVPAGGLVVEIGSHQGRSTLVLAAAVQQRGARLVAIDPFVEGRLFGGEPTRARFEANLAGAGLDSVVRLLADRSTEVRPTWAERLDLLYIDGKHDYWTVSDDLRWAAHLPDGGAIAIHDAFSSVGVTLGLLVHLLASRELRFVRRTASLAVLRREPPRVADRLRLLAQLPWFVRNLTIKVGLRMARVAGHHRPDPY
jgi:hypothetical protein